jgi:hypothetical protein
MRTEMTRIPEAAPRLVAGGVRDRASSTPWPEYPGMAEHTVLDKLPLV